jgi:hypothetical protein
VVILEDDREALAERWGIVLPAAVTESEERVTANVQAGGRN